MGIAGVQKVHGVDRGKYGRSGFIADVAWLGGTNSLQNASWRRVRVLAQPTTHAFVVQVRERRRHGRVGAYGWSGIEIRP